MLIRRALLMTVAGASVFWILFGALVVPAAAAGIRSHHDGSAHSAGSNGSRDSGHHCHGRGSDDPGDGGHCCEEGCCGPAPSPRPTESPAPTPEPTPSSMPTSHPERASSPTPHVPPPPAPVIAPHPISVTTPHPSPLPAPDREPAPGSRPPVLAPSDLTIPAVAPVSASGSWGVGAVGVIALSTILVAATVAAVSLVLMRRSG